MGFLWYAPVFGKLWQKETGLTNEDVQSGMGVTHGVSFLMMLAIAYFMGTGGYGAHLNEGSIPHGAFHGMWNAVRFAVPLLIINYLYQRRSLTLMLIDAAYAVAFFSVIGAVIAALPLYEAPPLTLEDAQSALEGAQEYLKEQQDALKIGRASCRERV